MKKLVFAAGLMLGTAALAQTTPTPTPTDDRIVHTNIDDGSPPERDARGIPVISAPAVVPAGANQPVTAPEGARVVVSDNQSAVFQTQPATTEYPVCTREITDNCVQAYERGRRPN